MKYWIGINIISNNEGVLTTVENAIPVKTDNRLWNTSGYRSRRTTLPVTGNKNFNASLYFNTDPERENFKVMLKALNGVINPTLSGSFIKMSECYYDELTNGLVTKRDKLIYKEVV